MSILKNRSKSSVTDSKRYIDMKKERDNAIKELAELKKKQPSIKDNLNWSKFISAMRRAPKRLMEVIEDILRKPPEKGSAELVASKQIGFDIPRKKRQEGLQI